MGEAVSLQDALCWRNAQLELLVAHQQALRRMRALVADSRRPDAYDEDFQLIETEVERVLERLAYWEEMVDRAERARRLRPILAGLGLYDE